MGIVLFLTDEVSAYHVRALACYLSMMSAQPTTRRWPHLSVDYNPPRTVSPGQEYLMHAGGFEPGRSLEWSWLGGKHVMPRREGAARRACPRYTHRPAARSKLGQWPQCPSTRVHRTQARGGFDTTITPVTPKPRSKGSQFQTILWFRGTALGTNSSISPKPQERRFSFILAPEGCHGYKLILNSCPEHYLWRDEGWPERGLTRAGPVR